MRESKKCTKNNNLHRKNVVPKWKWNQKTAKREEKQTKTENVVQRIELALRSLAGHWHAAVEHASYIHCANGPLTLRARSGLIKNMLLSKWITDFFFLLFIPTSFVHCACSPSPKSHWFYSFFFLPRRIWIINMEKLWSLLQHTAARQNSQRKTKKKIDKKDCSGRWSALFVYMYKSNAIDTNIVGWAHARDVKVSADGQINRFQLLTPRFHIYIYE